MLVKYTIRCDWPACESQIEVAANDSLRDRNWVRMWDTNLEDNDPCLCPTHRFRTWAELNAALDAADRLKEGATR